MAAHLPLITLCPRLVLRGKTTMSSGRVSRCTGYFFFTINTSRESGVRPRSAQLIGTGLGSGRCR